jgi:hypothetical protein
LHFIINIYNIDPWCHCSCVFFFFFFLKHAKHMQRIDEMLTKNILFPQTDCTTADHTWYNASFSYVKLIMVYKYYFHCKMELDRT